MVKLVLGLIIAICVAILLVRAVRAKSPHRPATVPSRPPKTDAPVEAPRKPTTATTPRPRVLEVRVKRGGGFGRFLMGLLLILLLISIGMWIVQQPIFGDVNPWGWYWDRPQDSTTARATPAPPARTVQASAPAESVMCDPTRRQITIRPGDTKWRDVAPQCRARVDPAPSPETYEVTCLDMNWAPDATCDEYRRIGFRLTESTIVDEFTPWVWFEPIGGN